MIGDQTDKAREEKNLSQNLKEQRRTAVRKYKPRQKSKIEKTQLKQRKIRFNRSMIHSDDVEIDQSILAKLNSQYLDRFLRSNPHSHKILLSSPQPHQFIYKIVYKNGDGIRPQKGMGIKMRFKTFLMNGKKMKEQFGSSQRLSIIGRNKLPKLYENLTMNVSEGEIGTMIFSPKYTKKSKGKKSQFPPFAVVRVDYWILQLRKRDYWEMEDVQKCEEAQIIIRQAHKLIKELQNEPESAKQKQKQIEEQLYNIRVADDFLHYCYIPKSDSLKKKVCAYEIYLLWFLGKKVLTLQLMDKYFTIEGRGNEGIYLVGREEELEKFIYKIKVEIQLELGMFEDVNNDIGDIREVKRYSEAFRKHFEDRMPVWLKKIEEFNILSEEQKVKKEEEYKKRKVCLQREENEKVSEYYVYNQKGYRENYPENQLEAAKLNCKVEYSEIMEWAIGKDEKKYYEQKFEEEKEAYSSEENEKEDLSKRFDPKLHIEKKPNQTQKEYEARRKEIQLENKFLQVKRVYGEDQEDYLKRREEKKKEHEKKQEEETVKESALMRKLKKKMKNGFENGKVPNMPRDQAYKCFDIK